MTDQSPSPYSGLIERLQWEPGDCPFCGSDPYHYVDNGVGMERVAVTCCDEGIALFQHGDPVLQAQITLRTEAASAIHDLEAENARLREALEPFGKASDKLHSGYDDGIAAGDHPMSHVFVSDLRKARAALSGRAGT
jgi:hypothetical protein